jgi:hypothetical protein
MALGSTQPLTEMSTRNLPGGKGRPVHNVGASTSHNPMDLYGLLALPFLPYIINLGNNNSKGKR